jgi:type II restriction enzyme
MMKKDSSAMQDERLEIVTTPTFAWLSERAETCQSRMVIGSPYVNDGILKLTNKVSSQVNRILVTRTDLRDFAVRASNLESLCKLAKAGFTIRSLNSLHAKVYILDDVALVTSANATFAGMGRNLECGLATSNKQMSDQLADSLLKGFGARRYPPQIKLEELKALHKSVAAIRVSLPSAVVPPPEDLEHSADSLPTIEAGITIANYETLLGGLSGWKRLTMRGILEISDEDFNMVDLLKVCQPAAAREYPRNNNVREKLRQQLQLLRDLGLVEFLGGGSYRRTMK